MGPSGTGVYDKEDNDQRATDADSLRGFEEDMAGSKASKLADKFNRNAEGKEKNSASPENLLNAEKAGGRGGLGPISKDKKSLLSGNKGEMAMNGLRGQAKNFLQKHRKKLLLAGVGGLGLAPIIGLIIFFIGLLALPNYAENVAARQFAKVTRAAAKSVQNMMREKHAIASLTDDDHTKAKNKYANLKSKTFERIDRLRPNKVMQNLSTSNNVQYHYEKTSVLKRDRLVAISFSNDGGKTFERVNLTNPGYFDRIIHPVRTLQARADTTRQLTRAVNEAFKANDPKVPTVIRAIAVKNFLKKHGISLKGLVASRYLGKDTREARATIQQDSYDHTKDKTGKKPFSQKDLADGLTEAEDAQEKCVRDPECLAKTVASPGDTPSEVTSVIEKRFDPNRINVVQIGIGAINPIYDVALPVCLVYDGSRLSPDSIDARSDESQRTASLVMSTADQQREGNSINGEAVGAMNWKLGDTNESNALKRASGQNVNTLANTPSTQASPFGGFGEVTIFNVVLDGVDKGMANTLNKYASDTCPTLTDPLVGVVVGLVNVGGTILLSIFTGGGAAAAEQAAAQSARFAVQKALSHVVKEVIQTITTKQGLKKLGKYAYREVQFWGAVEIATYLSRILVGMHAITGNGLAVGASFANDADNGANQLGNNMMRTNYGGRALTNAETAESISEDDRVIYEWNSEKPTFERYFALDNPNSMLTRVGMTLNSNLNANFASTALPKISSIFNPFTALPKLFGSMHNRVAFAQEASVANQVYGNVQMGWTKAELELVDKTPSYSLATENEYQLDQRGDRDKIEEEYGPCFNDSMGKMIGDKWIVRDNESGDVSVDNGKCSPKELGPNNPKYGDGVFRYRLFLFYNGSLSTLEGIDHPVKPGTVQQNTSGAIGSIPSGTTQELAQKILASDNIRFQVEPRQREYMEQIAKTGKAHCGTEISPKLLGVILAASTKYKLVIGVLADGHTPDNMKPCSEDGFHPKGSAVDINGVNPLDNWEGGTGSKIEWYPSEMSILKNFYNDVAPLMIQAAGKGGLGQKLCWKGGVSPTEVKGIDYFKDSCDHIHLDLRGE